MRRTIPYGRFALIEPRGAIFGHVVVAPEYVLMQRAAHTSIRDVSYLAVWSETRSRAIASELAALAADSTGVVAAAMPEVLAILRAMAAASVTERCARSRDATSTPSCARLRGRPPLSARGEKLLDQDGHGPASVIWLTFSRKACVHAFASSKRSVENSERIWRSSSAAS